MTTRKKGTFADKGAQILGEKPSGLGDFLSESPEKEESVNTETQKDAETESRQSVTTAKRTDVKTGTREHVVPSSRFSVKNSSPTQREDLRFPLELSERLRSYAFDHRTKKNAVMIEALGAFLKKNGY